MVSKAVITLLFTAAVVSGHVLHRPKSHPHQMVLMPALSGCPSPMEPGPIICKFMQPNQIFDYKPQFIAPTTYIPPLVVEKCDQPQLDIEIPLPEKPVVIPEAPILPPITIPKFPVPVIVEKPIPPPMPIVPSFIPEVPMEIPVVPAFPPMPFPAQPEPCLNEEVLEFHEPMVVPQPPELPAFVMPELPAVEVPMPEPCLEDHPIPVLPIPEYHLPIPVPMVEPAFIPEMPVVVPTAPVLPPLEMPILPEIVAQPEPYFHDVAELPQLPTFVEPEEPVRVEVPIETFEDLPLPIAPFPEFSVLPVPVAEPCEPILIPEVPKIPLAPELPPFIMPELPEIIPEPERVEVVAPELPKFVMPQIPEPAMIAPCLTGEVAFIPQVPEPVMPVIPAYPELADPCEPSVKAMKIAELPPYFVRHAPHYPTLPMPYGFYPGMAMNNVRAVPHMHHL